MTQILKHPSTPNISEAIQLKEEWLRGKEQLDFGIGGINLQPRKKFDFHNISVKKRKFLKKLLAEAIDIIEEIQINIYFERLAYIKRKRHIISSDFEEKINQRIDHISSLEANWDEEGGIPYNQDPLDRMKSFVLNLKKELFERYNIPLTFPYILPGPEGSIDIHWKNNQFTLLINIPNIANEEITIAGYENKFHNRRNVIKRSTDYQSALRELLLWFSIAMIKKI